MKYIVVTLLGGNNEVFLAQEFLLYERKFVNVSVEIKKVPEDILKKQKEPGFDLRMALWQAENYAPKAEGTKRERVLSKR